MRLEEVMQRLESLGKERLKKMYMARGAREPLFGVATGEMKPLSRIIGRNQELAEQLYATGNYDAMYFAGVIADPQAMTEADFERWIEGAYFYMLSDFVVSVTLAETETGFAQAVADRWIDSGEELPMSAGWSCYCWLLGSRPDREFSETKIAELLSVVQKTIHGAPVRAKYSMNNFIYTAATSYMPLHEQAVETAKAVGRVEVPQGAKKSKFLDAADQIQKEANRGRLGFKRRYVRC